MNVLVVEGNQHVANLMSEALRMHDYYAQSCSDGTEAIQMISDYVYHLVLLDSRLSGLDAELLMETVAKREVPVVLLVGGDGSMPDDFRNYTEYVTGVLAKPFDVEQMMRKVRESCKRDE